MKSRRQTNFLEVLGLLVAILACIAAYWAIIPDDRRWPFNSQETEGSQCPSTRDDIAALIGGESGYWTPPDWAEGAWVYRNKGEFISLRYPGIGRLDVWIDGSGTVGISKDNAYLLDRNQFDEASFHCFIN